MSASSPVISCRNVWKLFGANSEAYLKTLSGNPSFEEIRAAGHIAAVRDVSLDIAQGEMLVIMGLSGIRLIRASDRPELAQIPILGISAHVQDDQIEAHLATGMNGFVAKPVSPERLSKALNSIKEGRKGDIYFSARQSSSVTSLEENVANALAQNEHDLGKEQAALLADMFRSSLAPLVEDLQSAETPALRKSIAHKAKGAAGNFGVHHMIELLSDIEKCAAQPKDYHEKVGALLMMVKELEQVLQHAIATLERPI